MVKKILNISLTTKILKKIDLYTYSVHKVLYIVEFLMKINAFLIKEEKHFIKQMEILEKVRNIIKRKLNSELIYSKKYLKTENKNV